MAREGFKWSDEYTQCILRAILDEERPRILYDSSSCDYLKPPVPYVDFLANEADGTNNELDSDFLDSLQV